MQFDLFTHSRDVMLRNDLIEALGRRDQSASSTALAALETNYPGDPVIAPARRLLSMLAAEWPCFSDHKALQEAIYHFDNSTVGDAKRVFGEANARGWLRPFREAFAAAASALPYSHDAPDACAAPLFLQAECWDAADQFVRAIPSWRRIPRTLAWAAEASFHLHGLDATWPLLAELAWLDAERFSVLCRTLPAPGLKKVFATFEQEASTTLGSAAWFPAWALIEHPDLRTVLRAADTSLRLPPEQACHEIAALLTLERQGRHNEIITHRKQLQALNTELFALYMKSRASG